MNTQSQEEIGRIAEIISQCESNPKYAYNDAYDSVLEIQSGGNDIIVLSDLHIGSGLNVSDNYTGNENFFADGAMQRFLAHARKSAHSEHPVLVLNGDFIDFLRITDVPLSDGDYNEWLLALHVIGMHNYTIPLLKSSIVTELKENYGLKTNDFKSVWKLHVSARGHEDVFIALAQWLLDGNTLIITKGNHDFEWYWRSVRNYLRYVLGRHAAIISGGAIETVLANVIIPNVRFIENGFVMDGSLYIEHGHRYDKFTRLVPEYQRELPNKELNYPFGSFFNRYLLNKIELQYPFWENTRPRQSLLPMVIKEDFPLALKIGTRYIWYLLRSIKRRYYWTMSHQVLMLLVVIGVPALLGCWAFWSDLHPLLLRLIQPTPAPDSLTQAFLQKLEAFAVSLLLAMTAYPLARLISWLQLEEPSSLFQNAKTIWGMKKYDKIKIVTLGHTHDPEQFHVNGKWYYNTGTWIPIVETTSASLREDKTYTYLHFTHDEDGAIVPNPLLRWDDDAERGEPLRLIEIQNDTPPPTAVKKLKRKIRWLFAEP